MGKFLALVEAIGTSPVLGLLFNLSALVSLVLSLMTYANTRKVEEKAEELNQKAQLLYRGPVLLERIRVGRQDLNELIQAKPLNLVEIASQSGVLLELVRSLDEKLDPDGTEQGRAIIRTAENPIANRDVLQLGRRLYTSVARFATSAEERIEDQKQSLL